MRASVDRGEHRESINAEDYKRIIEFRERNIELNEYVQADQINKDIKSVICAQKQQRFLKRKIKYQLGKNLPGDKSTQGDVSKSMRGDASN